MRIILSYFIFLSALNANAQKFYFPKQNYKDSVTLAATMPLLANQLISQINEESEEDSLSNLILWQLVAKDHTSCNSTIYSLRKRFALLDTAGVDGFALQFEVYNLSKLGELKEQKSFQQLFDSVYSICYAKLNSFEKTEAREWAQNTPEKSSKMLKDISNKLRTSDSLSYKDAKQLVAAYGRHQVIAQIYPLIQNFYAAEERAHYNIQNVLITMRDGSQIEVLIVTADSSKKLPAILKFSIYINLEQARNELKRWADNGYVSIAAFTRGKGKSMQDIEPYEHDAKDAYDVIDWISKRTYCNGKVGMIGGSYVGFSQWAAAKKMHPALQSIMPAVAVAPGIDYPFMHGIGMTEILNWIHYTTNGKETDYDDGHNDVHWNAVYKKWYVSGASFKSLDTIEGRPNRIFQRWLQHPYHDTFWKKMTSYEKDFSQINIPVLTVTGYYDDEQSGALYYFNQHHLHNKNANHYLIIGPYDHGTAQHWQPNNLSGYTIDTVAHIYFQDLALAWFNFTLKGEAKPAILKNRVNYEVMGANTWKHAPNLKSISNDTLTFYLSDKKVDGRHTLSDSPLPNTFISSSVNLADRTDTTNINRMFGVSSQRIVDSVLQYRNSIVFETKPFDATLIINNSFFW